MRKRRRSSMTGRGHTKYTWKASSPPPASVGIESQDTRSDTGLYMDTSAGLPLFESRSPLARHLI
eukprot:scaffold3344_cov138-Isochrysis_galbana.AAC.5